MSKVYDVVILGGGPAAITAGIYARRAGLDCIIIERSMPGGQVGTTYEVCNFPGTIKTTGIDLATKFFEHANSLNIEFVFEEVKSTILDGDIKTIETFGGTYKGRTVIICLGAAVRKLNLDNERKYIGKGISYCATCDGSLFKGKDVVVVGGGNTAIEDALYLANIVNKVYLVHRRDEFRAEKILSDSLKSKSNVELVLSSVVTAIDGNEAVDSITVNNLVTKADRKIDTQGVFVAIGRGPDTDVVAGVKLDEKGYIISDEKMRTNIAGVFVAGDIRNTPLRQIVTACSDGAIAATSAFEYISLNKTKK